MSRERVGCARILILIRTGCRTRFANFTSPRCAFICARDLWSSLSHAGCVCVCRRCSRECLRRENALLELTGADACAQERLSSALRNRNANKIKWALDAQEDVIHLYCVSHLMRFACHETRCDVDQEQKVRFLNDVVQWHSWYACICGNIALWNSCSLLAKHFDIVYWNSWLHSYG